MDQELTCRHEIRYGVRIVATEWLGLIKRRDPASYVVTRVSFAATSIIDPKARFLQSAHGIPLMSTQKLLSPDMVFPTVLGARKSFLIMYV